MRVRVYDNKKHDNERQRNEFEQMSSSRNAALPEGDLVNADDTHEWKRTHWGEYDKAPTGNKMYGDIYTINRPEQYDTNKKRVELKRRIREEFPDAKIKYDNGTISFRVPQNNDEFKDFVIKDDYTPTPIYNRPEYNVRLRKYYELPSIKQNSVMYYKPKDVEITKKYLPMAEANVYKKNGDWGDIGFLGSQYITDDNKQFKFDDNFDYNKYFHEVPYEQMQPGDLIFSDLYNHDGKLLRKGKTPETIIMNDRWWDDEGSAYESLVPTYEVVTDFDEHDIEHSRVYRPNTEKIYDDSEYRRVKKLNDEIKRENDYVRSIYTDKQFPSDAELGYKSNGGVLDATYNEQINRIRQPRFAGWRFKDGGIYIKEENRGKFTEQAQRAGMTTKQFTSEVLENPDKYSPTTVKRARFSRNIGGN